MVHILPFPNLSGRFLGHWGIILKEIVSHYLFLLTPFPEVRNFPLIVKSASPWAQTGMSTHDHRMKPHKPCAQINLFSCYVISSICTYYYITITFSASTSSFHVPHISDNVQYFHCLVYFNCNVLQFHTSSYRTRFL